MSGLQGIEETTCPIVINWRNRHLAIILKIELKISRVANIQWSFDFSRIELSENFFPIFKFLRSLLNPNFSFCILFYFISSEIFSFLLDKKNYHSKDLKNKSILLRKKNSLLDFFVSMVIGNNTSIYSRFDFIQR